jgi:hypothetical protein
MNRFCVAALARLHPICARHGRNIPLELYSTVGGTGRSRPDESVLYPAKSPQCLINALTGEVELPQNHVSGNATYQEVADKL